MFNHIPLKHLYLQRSGLFYWLSGGLSIFGAALIIIATARYGVGLYSDSITYISGAQNIKTGLTYSDYLREPVLVFPPVYSTVLAVFSVIPVELHLIARYLNAIFFGLIVGLATRWLIINTESLLLSLIGSAAIIFSSPLIESSVFALSEPLFILLTLMALFQMEGIFTSTKYQPIFLAGIYTSLACLTRYAGISLIITGCMLLLWWQQKYIIGQWIKRLALFITISTVPLGLWLLRNYYISETLTGSRVASKRSIIMNLKLMADVLTGWIVPGSIPVILRIVLLGFFCIGLMLVIAFAAKRNTAIFSKFRYRPLIPILLFIPAYLVFLTASVSSTALSPIDNRYLAPVYVPGILANIFVLNEIKQISSQIFSRQAIKFALLCGLTLWLIYPITGTARLLKWYLTNGAGGFHSTQWANSELISYLKHHAIPGIVYTNEAKAVYMLTGQLFERSPRQYSYESTTPTDDIVKFDQNLQLHGQVYLVMFHGNWWREYLYDAEFYKSRYVVEEVVSARDGEIYQIKWQSSDQADMLLDKTQVGDEKSDR